MSKAESQRASSKRSIIRMAQTVNRFTNDTSLPELETNLDLLDDYWTQFQAAQLIVESTAGPQGIDLQVIEMVDTETSFLETKVKLKTFIKRYSDLANQQGGNQGGNQGGQGHQAANSSRLPKLEVPIFESKYSTWMSFKDLFTSMVIDERGLSDARKLHYLKVSAVGEANDIVSAYETTDANFAIAWDALKERFENKRLIIGSHLDILFGQPIMTTESAVELRLLIRTTEKCLRSLNSLNGPTECWDWILINFIVSRLDTKTRRYWELTHTTKEMATWDQLVQALETRCNALESEQSSLVVVKKSTLTSKSTEKKKSYSNSSSKILSSSVTTNCSICNGNHDSAECKTFLDKNCDGRSELATKYLLCFKCLKPNHNFRTFNASKCQKCGKKHHVLLHNPNFVGKKSSETSNSTKNIPNQQESNKSHVLVSDSESSFVGLKKIIQKQVLLSTALIRVRSSYGHWEICRAFLDNGSQSNVITERCAKRLNLRKISCDLPVTGIGEVSAGTCRKVTTLEIMSCNSSFTLDIDVVLMKSITTTLPNRKFDISNWSYINDIQLADPQFNEPGKIDILIGAEHYYSLLLNDEQINGPFGCPGARNTVFGWILCGAVVTPTEVDPPKIFNVITNINLDESLRKFWEIEEIPSIKFRSLEDEQCDKYFESTHRRDCEGRFVVKLPFNDKKLEFGDSRSMALKRFKQIERRFANDEILHKDYVDVMRELQALNHMKASTHSDGIPEYFMPHHPVIKPFRLTTKMRIVMDASAKSSNGVSLNDQLYTGPRLQQDLLQILIRFRCFRIVVAADIEKMFRQILVNEEHRRYQKILWRENSTDPVQEYELNTVTFGTNCAPYLAVKSLQTLAQEADEKFHKEKLVISNDFYMDDLLTGDDHPKDVIKLVKNLQKILEGGKFPLRKWISNDNEVLQSIDEKVRALDNVCDLPFDQTWKALGLRWHPRSDTFDYKINVSSKNVSVSKVSILSVIARLYDPLGFLAPTIIIAKMFMRKLWLSKIDWNEPLSGEMENEWLKFQVTLSELENISIPRWIGSYSTRKLELHGFCDASEMAYAAVIYAKTYNSEGKATVHIVVAKSKIAPIKTLSNPKLKLCGAVLLTRFMNYVIQSLRLNDVDIFAWCDNTTVIDWLAKQPITWKTFVANRVSEIQTTFPMVKWRYVSSEDNPADCATRGVESSDLKHHNLWWTGPSWLTLEESHWPTLLPPTNSFADLEIRKSSVISQLTVIVNDGLEQLKTKFSSLSKLKIITAYVLRFAESLKGNRTQTSRIPNVLELDNALQFWLKFSQKKAFPDTLDRLNKGKSIKRNDSLLALNPIIGHDGLLRVGGRLVESSLKYDQKHQIILPKNDPITTLIIAEIHKLTLHGGAQIMLNHLRQKYWLMAGRRTINQHIRNCVKCCRVKGRLSNQIMGNLPKSRDTIGRAFLKSGVDYTGSIDVRVPTSNSRKFSIVKGYIAVFVCLSTKSIHLEVVSDQSTEAFMNALTRFVSRRGLCRELVSDNGSNFIGAKGELDELYNMLQDQVQCDIIKKSLANDGIDWHMHPPGAPHFSGFFEAGVKSTKFHLRRILGSTPFTFEEWITVLCQIEAVLNSRPLIPLSDDVNDLQVLTPGYFLIGEPLTAIPEPNLEHLKLNTLNRYQLMQRKVQEFWRIWSSDYLSTLQQRTKWKSPVDNLKVGQIVTIKDDDLPTTKWLIGRVINIFPGENNHVRVAKMKMANKNLTKKEVEKLKLLGFNVSSAIVKTSGGILERPIHKLCVLPINSC